MKDNKLILSIHLIASMIMFSFLIMYLLTGIIMINRNLFNIPPIEQNNYKFLVEKPMIESPGEYTKYLKERFNLKGRIEFNKNKQEIWNFYFNFQGDNTQITLTPAQDTLYFRQWKQKMTFFTFVNRIHVQRGFIGGWEYIAWAVMYDITCFSMIIFAITGIMLWFRARKRFKPGWWYLASGMLIPIGFIFLYLIWK